MPKKSSPLKKTPAVTPKVLPTKVAKGITPKKVVTKSVPSKSEEARKPTTKKVVSKKGTSLKVALKKEGTQKVESKKVSKTGGTKESPWTLTTPSGQSEYKAYRDESLSPPALVVLVGKTELRYQLRCIDDLHEMLEEAGDWVPLGSADEQKPAKEGTVEAWARSINNPVKGWYGIKKGLRGRFANYVPPVLKLLGLAEVEEKPKENRMRAL